MSQPVIDIENLAFAWKSGPQVLNVPEFRLEAGERVFLRGPSGSGKSTLLGLIAGVLAPQQGSVRVLGEDMTVLSASRRDRLRADHVGVIFQMFNLVPYLSVTGNVLLPLRFSPPAARRLAATRKARPAVCSRGSALMTNACSPAACRIYPSASNSASPPPAP